jgi:hypothetical protein
MDALGIAVVFFVIYAIVVFVTDRFIIRLLPRFIRRSKIMLQAIGYLFAFVGIFCIIEWGYGHTVVTLNSNEPFLSPFRWIWWGVSALVLGFAQAFLSEEKVLEAQVTDPAG